MPTDPSHFTLVAMQLVRGKVTPFLGAGVNLSDRVKGDAWEKGRNLPSGRELATYLAASDRYPDSDVDLLHLAVRRCPARGGCLLRGAARPFSPEYAPTLLHRFLAELVPILRCGAS